MTIDTFLNSFKRFEYIDSLGWIVWSTKNQKRWII